MWRFTPRTTAWQTTVLQPLPLQPTPPHSGSAKQGASSLLLMPLGGGLAASLLHTASIPKRVASRDFSQFCLSVGATIIADVPPPVISSTSPPPVRPTTRVVRRALLPTHMYHLSRRRAPPPALECPGECSATAQVVQSIVGHHRAGGPRHSPTGSGAELLETQDQNERGRKTSEALITASAHRDVHQPQREGSLPLNRVGHTFPRSHVS